VPALLLLSADPAHNYSGSIERWGQARELGEDAALWRADENWQSEKSLDCAISTPESAVIRRRYGEITPDQLLISLVGQAAAI
jgi:hypothetical protein